MALFRSLTPQQILTLPQTGFAVTGIPDKFPPEWLISLTKEGLVGYATQDHDSSSIILKTTRNPDTVSECLQLAGVF